MASVVEERQVGTRKIDWNEAHDILEVSEVKEQLDLKSSMVYKLQHPIIGLIVLVQASGADSAVISLT